MAGCRRDRMRHKAPLHRRRKAASAMGRPFLLHNSRYHLVAPFPDATRTPPRSKAAERPWWLRADKILGARWLELNRRPSLYKNDALPTELTGHHERDTGAGFEPARDALPRGDPTSAEVR